MPAGSTTTDDPANARPPLAILLALALAVLLAALDQTIVATALPTVAGELGGLDRLAWVVTAYLLAETVSMPLYGKLGDVLGRKRVLTGAILVFLSGSALSGLADSMTQLVAFRALQGLGAGGLIVTAMAVIADVVAPRERARYMSMIGGVFAVASVAGPLLGGFLVDAASWRWVFYVNLPVGGAALAVILAKLPARAYDGRARKPVDVAGGALLVAGASALVLIASWAGTEHAWTSPVIVGLAAAAVVSLAALVVREQRAADPVLPLELFRLRAFSAAGATGFFVGMALLGAVTFLPLYLQVVDGATPTTAGLRMLPFVVGSLVAAAISSRRLGSARHYRAYPLAGGALVAAGLLLLSRLDAATPDAVAALDMAITGLGIGLVMQVVILVAQNHAPRHHMGVATSTVTFARSIGAAIGVAIFGAIFASRLSAELASAPDAAQRVAGTGARVEPQQIHALPGAVRGEVIDAFAAALQVTFSVGAAFAAAAVAAVLLLPRDLHPGYAPAGRPAAGLSRARASAAR